MPIERKYKYFPEPLVRRFRYVGEDTHVRGEYGYPLEEARTLPSTWDDTNPESLYAWDSDFGWVEVGSLYDLRDWEEISLEDHLTIKDE